MITKNEQKQLKQIIGLHYTSTVLNILSTKRIRNKNGRPYKAAYIRAVFQGLRNNERIENVIWELAIDKKIELKILNNKKEAILKSL